MSNRPVSWVTQVQHTGGRVGNKHTGETSECNHRGEYISEANNNHEDRDHNHMFINPSSGRVCYISSNAVKDFQLCG